MSFDYQYKTQPFPHQRKLLEETAELSHFALFWEMGVGKTKLIIDNIAYLYLKGKINGALIVAPNGVDLNWMIDEIPIHLPENVKEQSRIMRFNTKKSGNKAHKAEVKWNREHKGLAWLIMSYDAFMTDAGKEAALLFMEQREVFYALDESVAIKTPGAKRTIRITKTAHRAKYRRIMDGYPAPKGAFDMYPQIKFLDEDFWKRHQWDSAAMFRQYFGVYDEPRTNHTTGASFQVLLGYQHLEELNKLIAPISSRLLKQDVLNLPPKIYQPRYFELSTKQRELYEQLREEYKIWLDKDTLITANLAIVRMLRLQQISCGYIPTGEDEPVHVIEGKNHRLELLEELLEQDIGKCIILARYRLDIQLIEAMLSKKLNSRKFVVYTGGMSDDDKLRSKKEFQDGEANYLLATTSSIYRGHTLHAAHNVIYYSNSFDLVQRKQSEDRAHRAGLQHSVNYIDLLGKDTIDRNIMLNLCSKMDTSDMILGDKDTHDVRSQLKNWLE